MNKFLQVLVLLCCGPEIVPKMQASPRKILGVLAAHSMPQSLLEAWAGSADWVLAADGALHRLPGTELRLAIGDFDSGRPHEHTNIQEVLKIEEQETTDCDKLLGWCQEQGIEEVTLVDFEGGWFDHTLANLSSFLKSELTIRLVLDRAMGFILRAGTQLEIEADVGSRVSVIPLARATIDLEGVAWPLSSEVLEFGQRISISNRTVAPSIKVVCTEGTALLLVGGLQNRPFWPNS